MKRISNESHGESNVMSGVAGCVTLGLAGLLTTATAAAGWDTPSLVTPLSQPPGPVVPVSAPPTVNAISDDGRRVLLTSTSDLLSPEDDNQACDVFVFDRAKDGVTAVSVKAGGGATASGASLGADFAADAGKVLFLSRASDLVAGDTNATWDVFLRDLATGENQRVSVFPEVDPGTLQFSMPQISRDGNRLLFEAAVTSLWGIDGFPGRNAFVTDLDAGTLQLTTTGAPAELTPAYSARMAQLSADGSRVAFLAEGGLPKRQREVLLREVGAGATTLLRPDQALPDQAVLASSARLSADGQFAVYQAEVFVSAFTPMYTNGVFLHDLGAGSSRAIAWTNNAFALAPPPSSLPVSSIAPVISAGAEAVAFCLPLRVSVPNAKLAAGPAQLLHYDIASQTTTLISAAYDTGEMIDTDALYPRISADGRFVSYLSRATNLVEGAVESRWRVYWWDSQSGENHVLVELPADSTVLPGQFLPVFSPNGQWLAAASPAPAPANGGASAASPVISNPKDRNPKSEGRSGRPGTPPSIGDGPAVAVVNLLGGTTEIVPLPLAREESSTGRGWIAIHPTGVSADGRYVALASSSGDPNGLVQAWRLNTLTGGRELLSATPDGLSGNANSTVPGLSADGTRAAFATYATNLTSPPVEQQGTVVLRDAGSGQTTLIGETLWPPEPALVSPDGRYVVEVSRQWNETATTTVSDAAGGLTSLAIPGYEPGNRSFSADGGRLALAGQTGIRVLDVPVYLAAEAQAGVLLDLEFVGLPTAFALSRDGTRLAYSGPAPELSPDVVVVAVDTGEEVFVREATGMDVLDLVLSNDGRRLAWWESAGPRKQPFEDIWWANLDLGTVALGAVAEDGESPPNSGCRHLDLSGDGRYLTFACLGDNLVPGDDNHAKDVFLRDLETGETLLVSRTGDGTVGNRWSTRPFFSANGRCLFFLSHASDLVADDLNQGGDLFKVEIVEGELLMVIQRNLTSGGARLLWNGEAGKAYRVEKTGDLGSPDWQPAAGEPGPDFSYEIVTDSPEAFYRVVELE